MQRFNGDGSDTTFTLSQTVTSVQDILVSVDGVVQDSNAYTVPDGTTLTFSARPSSGTGNIFVNYLGLQMDTVSQHLKPTKVTSSMVVCLELMHSHLTVM